jgi:hypothetical protein
VVSDSAVHYLSIQPSDTPLLKRVDRSGPLHDTSTQSSETSILGQPEAEQSSGYNLQHRFFSQDLPETNSQIASHQASENVLPSIEQVDPRNSSSLPSRPSPPSSGLPQFPDTYGSNPPPRPITPTNPVAMEEPPKMRISDMLKKVRADADRTALAQLEAEKRAASSMPSTPASIPSTPAPVRPPVVSQMIPLREPAKELPVASPPTSPILESGTSLHILPLGPKQFIVPLSLSAHVNSLYMDELRNVKRQTKAFINDGDVTTVTVTAMRTLLERLKMICDHQDLLVEEPATQNLEDTGIARWAENVSTKCVFVVDFLNEIQAMDMHVVILVRPGRMISILEACFRYRGFGYQRLDKSEDRTHVGEELLKITLIPTNFDHSNSILGPANVVIAFDSTFEPERHFKNLRGDCNDPSHLAPIISLVVVHSAEHIELCIPNGIKTSERIMALVTGVIEINQDVGRLREDYLLPDAAAKAVSTFASGAEAIWPLLPMPGIDEVEFSFGTTPEPDPDPDAMLTQPSGSTTQSYNTSSVVDLQPGLKRSFVSFICHLPYANPNRTQDVDEEDESSKRQRISPINGHGSHWDQTHISDTVTNPTDHIVPSSKAVLHNEHVIGEEQGGQIALLLKKASSLKYTFRSKTNIYIGFGSRRCTASQSGNGD